MDEAEATEVNLTSSVHSEHCATSVTAAKIGATNMILMPTAGSDINPSHVTLRADPSTSFPRADYGFGESAVTSYDRC